MKQPKLTAIIQSRWLTLFGHIMCMDDNTDAKRIPLAFPTADWRRQLGRPRITWLSTVQQDLKQHHLTLPKQQIWLRTALCGGWCRRMVLRNPELHARNDDDDDSQERIRGAGLLTKNWHTAEMPWGQNGFQAKILPSTLASASGNWPQLRISTWRTYQTRCMYLWQLDCS